MRAEDAYRKAAEASKDKMQEARDSETLKHVLVEIEKSCNEGDFILEWDTLTFFERMALEELGYRARISFDGIIEIGWGHAG